MPQTKQKGHQARLKRFIGSIWLFPAILTVLLILLTSLKISSSSIGIYHDVLYGQSKDPSLLLNHPQGIRSDEWIVTTQLTIAQHAAGYPRFNPNIDSGRDMSIVGDAPNTDWSTAFRPQNIAFFALPFEHAFAFKWWFLLYMVVVSCYFFVLRIFKNKRLFASLFSLAIGLSPFLFWWYQTGTLAPIFYGFLIILVSWRIIDGEPALFLRRQKPIYSKILLAVVLAYLLTCFALILYPPFQIPVAIAGGFFILGLILNKYGLTRELFTKSSLKSLSPLLLGLVLTAAIVFTFFQTRSNVINSITNTVYPGKRSVQAEGNSGYEILSTFLQPQLQRAPRAAHYYTNQSEASNFILLLPFLYLPGVIVLWIEYKKTKKINWLLASTQACISLFLLYLFVPVFKPVYRLFLLTQVANVRLFIGVGFIGVIQLLLIARSIENIKIKKRKLNLFVLIYSLLCLTLLLGVGQYARSTYPQFINSLALIGGLAILFSGIIFCFLSRRLLLGAALLLLFSLGSTYRIHPMYKGLGSIYNGKVIQAMDQVSKPTDSWATMDSLFFENFALMAGRDSVNGIKPYPDLSYWRQVEGPKGDYIYNRYAHSLFIDSESQAAPLKLTQADAFLIKFDCTSFIKSRVKFTLSTHKIEKGCVTPVTEVKYPAITFYIYSVKQ